MATLKAIRRRIASVKSTMQITRAMKLMSATRLRRAQEALVSARPYAETLARVAGSLLEAERAAVAPREGARQAQLIVVISSDRGLCGGYNVNIARAAEESARRKRAEGFESDFVVVGRKGVDHFKRARQQLLAERTGNLRLATVALATDLASAMIERYRSGEVREVSLAYSHFRSVISQQPTIEQVLPVVVPAGKAGEPATGGALTDYLIEPSRAALVPVVFQSYVLSAVFHALLEAEASEHGARMTAMEAATNNAIDMIDRYTLDMNRARQAGITRELMDIIGGSEALRG
jgi:F-type H+-transporting ATPase subunit gamma